MLFGFLVDWARTGRIDQLHADRAVIQSQLDDMHQEVRRVGAESNRVRLQVERAEALRSKRAWSELLQCVVAVLPVGCWLQSVGTDPVRPIGDGAPVRPGGTPEAAPVGAAKTITIDAPRKLRIVGFAESDVQPVEFVSALKSASLFSAVNHEKTRRELVGGSPWFRFELTCEW
jgi:Tfp pilus assembly protein PilN